MSGNRLARSAILGLTVSLHGNSKQQDSQLYHRPSIDSDAKFEETIQIQIASVR